MSQWSVWPAGQQLCKNRLDLKSLQVHSPCAASCRVVWLKQMRIGSDSACLRNVNLCPTLSRSNELCCSDSNRNLLADNPSEKLDIKMCPDGSGQLYVPGLTEFTVESVEDINKVKLTASDQSYASCRHCML